MSAETTVLPSLKERDQRLVNGWLVLLETVIDWGSGLGGCCCAYTNVPHIGCIYDDKSRFVTAGQYQEEVKLIREEETRLAAIRIVLFERMPMHYWKQLFEQLDNEGD